MTTQFNPSQFDRDTAFPPIFVKELEYKCSERGDEMLGNWENKCSAFGRTKVRRKSPAVYQTTQIKKNIVGGPSLEPIEPI